MYCHQRVLIKWVNCMSRAIKTSNGVKQGGNLSPVLFTLYMDELLVKLKKTGFGCHIGNTFVGSMSYADDVVLLSPTLSSLKQMLDISHEFGAVYDVRFNPDKYNLLHFSMSDVAIDGLYFNNVYINCVKVLTHLGHYFGPQSEEVMFNEIFNKFIINVNSIISLFGKAHSNVKYSLFKSFCMALYGSSLWNFYSKGVRKFYVSWRKCIQCLLNLPNSTHCRYLQLICEDTPIHLQL